MSADAARTVATWLWEATADVREIVAFVTARRLREVYVAVPLSGVDDRVASNLAKGAARQVKYLKEIDRNGAMFETDELDDRETRKLADEFFLIERHD